MMDWNYDPELRKLRQEFLQSLLDRMQTLKSLKEEMSARSACISDKMLSDLHQLVHKLAGSAKTYDFEVLGQVAEEFEGFLVTVIQNKEENVPDIQKKIFHLIEQLQLELHAVFQHHEYF